MSSNPILWQPSAQRIARANITRFADQVIPAETDAHIRYEDLYRWSVASPQAFWPALWHFTGAIGQGVVEPALEPGPSLREARWFPNLQLNYAENLLRTRPDAEALVVFRGEDKVARSLAYAELRDEVSRLSQALQQLGVHKGDRVAGVMPNGPEAVIAMLAAVSLGAVWSSCSPDFGVNGVVDRFGQIEPAVLFLADGYYYNGKWQDLTETNRALSRELKTLRQVIGFSYTGDGDAPVDHLHQGIAWPELIKNVQARPLQFETVEFDHPLFIMYSSGTTGKPKCIVHGHGGTLIQHLKEHQLHADVKPGDRLFYFTTCGWMMWNWLVSGLASGATLMLYDGSPFCKNGDVLFDYIDNEQITHFGTSAKFIDACHKAGLKPRETHTLDSVQTILSTGSVLVPDSFDYVYRDIKTDVCLSSISGGTDLIACFAAGNPTLPVYRGELQCRALGMDVAVYNDAGESIVGEKGELVCTEPFPSMPVCFWNDPDGEKYCKAYFDKYPNAWCQGDYVELTQRGTMIFYGRSDAVLNPGGVRIGTAEIYRQVEALPEIAESLVIGQNWQNDVRVVLFVRLQDGVTLDDALTENIKQQIRRNTTPRHVPAKIIAVDDIPRTKSGKIVELAVRKVVHGEPINNVEALANPEALDLYKDLPQLKT